VSTARNLAREMSSASAQLIAMSFLALAKLR
jgi:hypothetical protein